MSAAAASLRRSLPSSAALAAALGLAVAVAAVLRLIEIDLRSFWFDEAYTWEIVSGDLAHVVDTVPETEFTPPLYYLLAWGWGGVVGTDETALRSLSALFGIGTVIATYFAGRVLVDARTGVGAAALCAVSPFLIWYSQEARAYSLLALLSALSLLALALALREPADRRAALAWAVAATLALATHYFAVFVVVPQAAWLLWCRRDRQALVAVVAVGIAGLALLGLALHQRETALLGFLDETPLSDRAEGALTGIPGGIFADTPPGRFPLESLAYGVALLLVPFGLSRLDAGRRRGAAVALSIAGVALAVPLAAALVGFDYVVLRNFIAVVTPLSIGLAAAMVAAGTNRIGIVALAGVLACSLLAVHRSFTDESLRSIDWRVINQWIGPRDPGRVIVTHWPGQPTLEAHRDATMLGPEDERVPVSELVVTLELGGQPRPPTRSFSELPRETVSGVEIARFRSDRPVTLSFAELAEAAGYAGFFVLDRPDGEGRL